MVNRKKQALVAAGESRRRIPPRYVNEEGQPYGPDRDLVMRCDNNEQLGARETTSWNDADVTAVMAHSPEVHPRSYLTEISGEQTKASVARRRPTLVEAA